MLTISDLRERPVHADAVAGRIWAAFWRHKGAPLSALRTALEENLRPGNGIPIALVAEIDGVVCRTVSVIASDKPARPHLTP